MVKGGKPAPLLEAGLRGASYGDPTKAAGFEDRLVGKVRQTPNFAVAQSKAEA